MNQPTTTDQAYEIVTAAHRELMRYESRTGGDWARDGYGIEAAQKVVDRARADYMAAFLAYAAGREG
jgi:hypothetical protein